jgi:cyclopropane fatty-acyl-phospholipid synthase-like methyltransferase
MTKNSLEAKVAAHYGRTGLLDAISTGLAKLGVDPEHPSIEDLAPVDEFHTAGRIATQKAFELMPLAAGMQVLDAGCGIGGTSRSLAKEHGCRVTGLDPTADYIEVARALTARTGLEDRCAFKVGSVLDMPFADETFDAGLTFHVAMNIEDRATFYDELQRVLKPGAPLCLFDVMKGPAAGMLYPVPWAETAATSFLKSADETESLLDDAGFEVTARSNLRDFAIGFFREVFAKAAAMDGPPPIGLHLLTGANTPEKFQNYAKALDAHQIEPVIIMATCR